MRKLNFFNTNENIIKVKRNVWKNRYKALLSFIFVFAISFTVFTSSKAEKEREVLSCLGLGNSTNSLVSAFGTDNEPIALIKLPVTEAESAEIYALGFMYNDEFNNRTFNIEFHAKSQADFDLLKENDVFLKSTSN
jgi:uncharacterized protein YpmS